MTSCPSRGQLLATYQPKIFANQEKKDKITNEKFNTRACYLRLIYILLFLIGLNCDSSYFGTKLAWQAPT